MTPAISGVATVCAGTSTTLTASTATGIAPFTYVWSTGETSQSVTVSPYSTTAYYVTITDVNGCTATSAVTTVNVNQLPVVNAGNDATVCNGSSATLMATGATTYVWSPVAGLSATTGSTVVATPLATTTYTVTGTDANGCVDTDTVTVNVVNQPLAVISPATSVTICAGETTTLAANAGTGFTYVWSTGATTQAIDVSPTTTTNYTVTVTNSTGCSTTSIITQVIVNEALTPIISGVSTVCAGTSTTLTASTSTGTLPLTYLWSTGATTEAITVTPVSTTSYFVTITDANGCSATTAVTTVEVNPLPVVDAITGSTTVCAGSETIFANSTPGGVWTSANSSVASVDAAGVVTGGVAGLTTITYTVTDVNGCVQSVSADIITNAQPVAPVITVTGPTMICPNTTTDLSVPAIFATYQWNTGQTTPSITVGLAGTYYVTVTSIEGCSVNSAPVTITVGDTIAPVITAPADITYNLVSGCSVSALNIGQPVTSDNCAVLSVTNNAPFTFAIGTTEVIWTVYDVLGNSSTAIQTITVVDTVAPQIIAPGAVTVATNINCEASGVFIGTAIGTDNCGFTVTNDAPSVFPLGTTTVTWTITDLSGNTATATQLVTVLDTEAPYVNVVDAKLILSLDGEAVLDFSLIDVNSTDNCGIDTIIFSQSLFTCSDVGVTPVVITVIDNSGNVSIANIMVTVEGSGIDSDFDGIDDSCDDFIDTNAIVIPSGFSPNKDGYNDVFEILGLDNFDAKNLTVYNRHGGLVYQNLAYDNTWDGTFLNTGEPVPDATYYYILRLDNGQFKAGYVYINRVQ